MSDFGSQTGAGAGVLRAGAPASRRRCTAASAGRTATVKVRLTRGVIILTVLTVAVAVGLLYRSWDSQTSTWESGLLVQFGSTLLLFVPLAYLTYSIEAGLDRVSKRQDQISTRQEETASNVARLTEEVAQAQADLRLTREQLSEVVRERITEHKSKDSTLFKAVGEAPSQTDVLNSLERAKEMGVIPDQGCRVDLTSGCYLRFNPQLRADDPDEIDANLELVIELTLERIDAAELGHVDWYAKSSVTEIAVDIAELMQASGVYSGDNLFDAGKIFADLSTLLSLGYDSTTRGAVDPVRHIIQLCSPQWAVCDDGVYCTDQPYQIAAWRLNEDWIPHMSEKTWVDINSLDEALRTCSALFETGALAVKPRRSGDGPS